MTVLVLDNPELIAKAAMASGFQPVALEPGCKKPHRMRFHYGFNRHALEGADLEIIKQHAAYLVHNPAVTVRIHGHSDGFGAEDYNRFLSRLRANAVARVLMQEGVPDSRILMSHWGSARPLATPADHAANRRVELEYLSLEVARAL